MKLKSPSLTAVALVALAIVVLDQWTKFLVIRHFQFPFGTPGVPDPDPIVLIPGCLQIIYVLNTGAAFSLFREHTLLLAFFSTFVAGVIAFWAWRMKPEELFLRWPLALILGGAIGNLIDRYRLRHVTDFIDAYWGASHFPTFNVADSGVCVGMGLLVLLSFFATSPAKIPSEDVSGNNPA